MSLKRPSLYSTGSLSPPPIRRKVESTTTSKAVATFFKPASQKEPERLNWRIIDRSLIVGRYSHSNGEALSPNSLPLPRKVAAFDLDDTIITSTGGGYNWTKSATNWKWWDATVPAKLKELHQQGFQIVIISNQGNISIKEDSKTLRKDKLNLVNFKSQLTAILRQLDLPISVYAATAHDKFRKPRTGMWEEMLDNYDLDTKEALDLGGSLFVGDAAGREKTNTRRKDHSCADRDLAANIGIAFQTPDEFFLNKPPEPFIRLFEPKDHLQRLCPRISSEDTEEAFVRRNTQDLVVFCGSPGAGKSTFYWTALKSLGYERVNQDILKSREKCLKVAKEQLAAGLSVAVDNTNADPDTRAHWVRLAREFMIPVRCVYFSASTRLCQHNDCVRALNVNLMNPEKRTMLPGVAFRSFSQRFVQPELSEGFQDIVQVNFAFEGTTEQRRVWSLYWVSNFVT